MVEEQQVGGGFGHFESAYPGVVNTCMTQRIQIEPEIMGQQRPNDVAMGHKHVGCFLRDLQSLFDRRHGTLLHVAERFTA